jgi:hypothetical protein
MKTLEEYKAFLKDYYESLEDKEDDTWEDYWQVNLDALKDDDAIVVIGGVKYVKD